MRSNKLLRSATILGLGTAGLVGGHALGYVATIPDTYHRTALLASTGHQYFPSASWMALIIGIAAVVAGVASGYLHRPTLQSSLSRTLLRLAMLQCLGFVALEVGERVVSSAPFTSLSLELLAIGLFAQLLCAVVVALIVVGVRKLGSVLSTRAPVARAATTSTVFVTQRLPRSRNVMRERVRGPPALLLA